MSCVLDNIRRFNLALDGIDRTMRLNERRKGDWRRRTVRHHLRHAFFHLIFRYLGIGRDPHLNHAATRLLMALQLEEEKISIGSDSFLGRDRRGRDRR